MNQHQNASSPSIRHRQKAAQQRMRPPSPHIGRVDKVLGKVDAQHVREGSGQRKAGAPHRTANVQGQGLAPLPCTQPASPATGADQCVGRHRQVKQSAGKAESKMRSAKEAVRRADREACRQRTREVQQRGAVPLAQQRNLLGEPQGVLHGRALQQYAAAMSAQQQGPPAQPRLPRPPACPAGRTLGPQS